MTSPSGAHRLRTRSSRTRTCTGATRRRRAGQRARRRRRTWSSPRGPEPDLRSPMRFGPPVSYTHTPRGSALAYQVVGDGDQDLVFLLGWPSHLALMWENPAFAEFL